MWSHVLIVHDSPCLRNHLGCVAGELLVPYPRSSEVVVLSHPVSVSLVELQCANGRQSCA